MNGSTLAATKAFLCCFFSVDFSMWPVAVGAGKIHSDSATHKPQARQIYPILYNRRVSSFKPIAWLGDSLARLRAAPADIRSDAGYQLDLVQRGETPADFKPMPDVGSGVMEIRLHGDNEFRVFYVARFEDAVYVLHCFVKKTQVTRKADIDLGKQRYATFLGMRKSK